MTKVTLANVGNLIDATTAATTINSNSAAIVAAVENTLSRDGTQPNTMGSTLDMNSNRIINLASPASSNEPARLIDLATVAAGGTVTLNNVPTGGATGSVLTKNTSSNYDMGWVLPPTNLFTLGSTPVTLGSTITTVAGAITWSGVQTFSSTPVFTTINSTTITNTGTINSTGIINSSAGKITVGPSPSVDDSSFISSRALTPGSGLLNSHGYRDETVATQNVTASQFSGYSSFDAAAVISGSATTPMNHVRNFQARIQYNSVGHVNEMAGLWIGHVVNNGSAIVDQMYGVQVINNQITSGVVSNQYAYHADTLSGAGNSYFLFGGNNPSVLNGNLYVGGRLNAFSNEAMNIQYNGSTQQGFAFCDTYAPAASLTAVNFIRNNSIVGSITETLSATVYNTSSDERLKDFTGKYDPKEAISIIKADPVRTFKWKSTQEEAIGWGAQTSYEINHDLATPETESTHWGIDKGARTPYLWAAMTDVISRLEALESKI